MSFEGKISREGILTFLRQILEKNRAKDEAELGEFLIATHLSKEMLDFNLDKIKKSIDKLSALLSQIDRLEKSKKEAHLFVFQRSLGKSTTGSAPYNIGTDSLIWDGSGIVSFEPNFSGKRTGERWEAFISRADQTEYFHLILRI